MNLEKLIDNIGLTNFLEISWQKKCIVYKKVLEGLSFQLKDFYNIIEFGNIDFPHLVCLNKNGQVPICEYVDITQKYISSKIIPQKVYNLLDQSCTVRIKNIDKFNSEINLLKSEIQKIFTTKITINGYLSGNNNQGINLHYDTHDIFVLQVTGDKKWQLGDFSKISPCSNYRPDMYESSKLSINNEVTIEAGDILYLPKAMWHQTATETLSLHLTVGIHSPNIIDIIPSLTDILLNTSKAFREPIEPKIVNNRVVFKLDVSKHDIVITEMRKALRKMT